MHNVYGNRNGVLPFVVDLAESLGACSTKTVYPEYFCMCRCLRIAAVCGRR